MRGKGEIGRDSAKKEKKNEMRRQSDKMRREKNRSRRCRGGTKCQGNIFIFRDVIMPGL